MTDENKWTFVWPVPKAFKDREGIESPSNLAGEIHLLKPTQVEKFQFIEECGYDITPDGKVKPGDNKWKTIIKMLELSKKHYVKVDVTKTDGTKLESFDDLHHDQDCSTLMLMVAEILMNGFSPTKN
ncbi:MAG: hypothetical protein SGI74_12920 [Oligoflexia bacterium]|nr:hypothetical protein [Oligoflexia bacterium]